MELFWVVLHVGVLDADKIAGRMREAGSKRRPFAAIFDVVQDVDFGMMVGEFAGDREALVV